jgi:molecular chaperone HscB
MLNYFTLFGVKQTYLIDLSELEKKYFALQLQYHPDRAVGKTEQDKMQIIKTSADINQGYKVLNDDVERTNHLLEINNVLVNKEKNNTYKPSQALLVEQMELRERASDIESGNENKAELLSHIDAEFIGAQKDFNDFFGKGDYANAAQVAMKLKYLDKLKQELDK